MTFNFRKRRTTTVVSILLFIAYLIVSNAQFIDINTSQPPIVLGVNENISKSLAARALSSLEIKGRAAKTGYSRDQFGGDWLKKLGCDMRNIILNRDLENVIIDDQCNVKSGILFDPYTGKQILFFRGSSTSGDIQIDHVVALSDAWQKGAQDMSYKERVDFANDPLELLAVDGQANQQKSDGDAATWLPSNKSFRCQYVARQIAIKQKYNLWVTQAEYDAIKKVLNSCPEQALPIQ